MKKRKLLLDVGCGEAKCCIGYVKQGYDVIGIEKKKDVYEKAKRNIENSDENSHISIQNGDIRNMELDKQFNAVVFNYVLMFMPKKEALQVVETYHGKLKAGGEMLIRMLMDDDPVAVGPMKDKKNQTFYPSKEEMEQLRLKYQGKLEFFNKKDEPHGDHQLPHMHSVGMLKIEK